MAKPIINISKMKSCDAFLIKLLEIAIQETGCENTEVTTYNNEIVLLSDSVKEIDKITEYITSKYDNDNRSDYDIRHCVDVLYRDQYIICDGCGKVVCSYPEYGCRNECWIDRYTCSIYCKECMDKTEYIYSLLNKTSNANTLLTEKEIIDKGFVFVNRYSTDFGDIPEDILKEEQKKYPDYDFLFSINYAEPFDIDYTLFGRPKNYEENN